MTSRGWRIRPPAHSPLEVGALLQASLGGSRRDVARLRGWLRERYAAEEVLPCGSGTEALRLAIEVAVDRLGGAAYRGDRPVVGLPAYSCWDLATAALGAGAAMRFYDLDPERLTPAEDGFGSVLDSGVRIMVVAPLWGVPVAWDRLREMADARGALLIEDAAQGIGASWERRPVGAHGELSVLSFGRGKGWTGGGGGALLARGGAAEALRGRMAGGGVSPAGGWAGVRAGVASWLQWGLTPPSLYAVPARIPALGLGETRWKSPSPVRVIPRFSARLALGTGQAALEAAEARRERARELLRTLAAPGGNGGSGIVPIRPVTGGTPGWLRLPVLLRGGLGQGELAERARREGIAGGYPAILPDLPTVVPALAEERARFGSPGELHPGSGGGEEDAFGKGGGGFPGARRLVEELVTLPVHRYASPEVAHRLLEWVGGGEP